MKSSTSKVEIVYLCILFLLSTLTGFYLMWVKLGNIPFQLTLTDIFTLVFTATLVYYAALQNRLHRLQYQLSIQTSQPIVLVKRDDKDRFKLLMVNLGERPAYDITCRIIGWPDYLESLDIFSIKELPPNRPEITFLPENYQIVKHLAITVSYFTDVEKLDFKSWGSLI